MKRELTYAEKNLIGIRKVTIKKATKELQKTFNRMMAKVKPNTPKVENGRVFWG